MLMSPCMYSYPYLYENLMCSYVTLKRVLHHLCHVFLEEIVLEPFFSKERWHISFYFEFPFFKFVIGCEEGFPQVEDPNF